MRKAWVRAAAMVLVSALLTGGTARAGVAEVGQPPPLFALADEDGHVQRLQDLLGKPIVLYFTHNQCHYCTQVIAYLKRAHVAYHERDLTIVTINVWADGGELIRRYKEQFGLPFRMLAGKNTQLLRNYEVNYVPILVFIGKNGRIRRIDHHYILEEEFEATVREIVDGA